MAKVVYGPIVSDARNKHGGSVYTKGHSGAVVRRKVSPIQPRTSCQMNVRASFTGLSKAWSALSETVRAAWIAFCANNPVKDVFGATVTLTGHQMYVRLNRALATIGVAALTNPPANLSVNYAGPVSATHDGPPVTTIPVSWANPGNVGGSESCVIFATAPMSVGRKSGGAKFRFVQYSAPGLVGPYFLYADYADKFGAPPVGTKIFIRAFLVRVTNGAQSLASEFALTI
jgi:hypothetical protein